MIHYKFKGTKIWDSVSSFDAAEPLNVLNLKRQINKRARSVSDLVIIDAESGMNYAQDGYILPRNAKVIVRRIPLTKQNFLQLQTNPNETEKALDNEKNKTLDQADGFGEPIYNKPQIQDKEQEEEAKMLAVLNKATQYKSSCHRFTTPGLKNNEGSGGMHEFQRHPMMHGRTKNVPPNHYVCNRCGQRGHFIRFCPTNGNSDFDIDNPRRATGIPRKFLKVMSAKEAEECTENPNEEENEELGDKVLLESKENGQKVATFYRVCANNDDFQKFYKRDVIGVQTPIRHNFLSCPLCLGICRNAVAVKCCFTSFCTECIYQKLAADSTSCPICAMEVSPDELLVNQGIRKLVQ